MYTAIVHFIDEDTKPVEVDSFIQSQGFNGKVGPEISGLLHCSF